MGEAKRKRQNVGTFEPGPVVGEASTVLAWYQATEAQHRQRSVGQRHPGRRQVRRQEVVRTVLRSLVAPVEQEKLVKIIDAVEEAIVQQRVEVAYRMRTGRALVFRTQRRGQQSRHVAA
jgi:hypothetical protein